MRDYLIVTKLYISMMLFQRLYLTQILIKWIFLINSIRRSPLIRHNYLRIEN